MNRGGASLQKDPGEKRCRAWKAQKCQNQWGLLWQTLIRLWWVQGSLEGFSIFPDSWGTWNPLLKGQRAWNWAPHGFYWCSLLCPEAPGGCQMGLIISPFRLIKVSLPQTSPGPRWPVGAELGLFFLVEILKSWHLLLSTSWGLHGAWALNLDLMQRAVFAVGTVDSPLWVCWTASASSHNEWEDTVSGICFKIFYEVGKQGRWNKIGQNCWWWKWVHGGFSIPFSLLLYGWNVLQ